eukprot:366348-Chlamydomonas_euryale.AAC.6
MDGTKMMEELCRGCPPGGRMAMVLRHYASPHLAPLPRTLAVGKFHAEVERQQLMQNAPYRLVP